MYNTNSFKFWILQEFPNNKIFSGPPWDQPSVLATPSRRHPHATKDCVSWNFVKHDETCSTIPPQKLLQWLRHFWPFKAVPCTRNVLVSLTIFCAALRVTQQCPPWHQFLDGKKKSRGVSLNWSSKFLGFATEPEHPWAVRHWPPQWRHLHRSCCLTKTAMVTNIVKGLRGRSSKRNEFRTSGALWGCHQPYYITTSWWWLLWN